MTVSENTVYHEPLVVIKAPVCHCHSPLQKGFSVYSAKTLVFIPIYKNQRTIMVGFYTIHNSIYIAQSQAIYCATKWYNKTDNQQLTTNNKNNGSFRVVGCGLWVVGYEHQRISQTISGTFRN
jgi:hypothetical protein